MKARSVQASGRRRDAREAYMMDRGSRENFLYFNIIRVYIYIYIYIISITKV